MYLMSSVLALNVKCFTHRLNNNNKFIIIKSMVLPKIIYIAKKIIKKRPDRVEAFRNTLAWKAPIPSENARKCGTG